MPAAETRRVVVLVRQPAPPPPIDPLDHAAWAVAIARRVRKRFRFRPRSAEEEELEGEALLALVAKARAFVRDWVPAGGDAAGAFRGYASAAVRGECQRLARRLKNGGTYHTRRESSHPALEVEHLLSRRTPAGDPIDHPDPLSEGGEWADDHAPPPPACDTSWDDPPPPPARKYLRRRL